MESNQPLDSNFKEGLHLSGQSLGYLKETAKWGKFLAIVGFVMLGLVMLIFLLLAIFVGSTGLAALDGPESAVFGAMGAATIMFYVFLFIIFYFIPSLFLYRFATNMQIALRNEDSDTLQTSLSNMKSLFKFFGILTAIFLGLYALIFVFSIFFGGLAAVFG